MKYVLYVALLVVVTGLPLRAAESDEASARQFLHRMVLDKDDMRLDHLNVRPGFQAVADLAAQDKPLEALAAYQRYFFSKLRAPEAYGISTHDVNPYVRGISGPRMWPDHVLDSKADPAKVIEAADKLLTGMPADLDWSQPAFASGNAFTPLAHAYLLTGKEDYLRRWVVCMDEWAQQTAALDAIQPCFTPDSMSGTGMASTIVLTRLLAAIANQMPVGSPAFPPITLARIVNRLLYGQALPGIVYIRSNTHNWTPSAAGMLLGLFYDEFKIAPFYFREGRRRGIEDNAVTQNLRDGTENQQCPWYNENFMQTADALRLMSLRRTLPSWKDVPWVLQIRDNLAWIREVQDHLDEHANYFIHLRTPQSEWPLGFRGGDKRQALGIPAGQMFNDAPAAYYNPVNASIVAAITQPGGGLRPTYTADWFPYGGYNIVREGWEKDSGYGSMFCSSHPGAYGGYRSRSDNNVFHVAAFGHDLLVSDEVGHYMYPSSPLTVDGLQQFFHVGIYKVPEPAGHKVYEVSAWLNPAPWRWHASDRYNLMEGIYSGPYADVSGRASKAFQYGLDESMQGALPLNASMVRDVTHQRIVMFVRQQRLWIVTDRLISTNQHHYEQCWLVPIKSGSIPAFKKDDIHVDAATRMVFTTAPTGPNFTIHQFSSASLTYSQKIHPQDEKNHYQMYGWNRVGASWSGTGPQALVTVIHPYEGATDPLREIRADGATGFQATTADGSVIHFQTGATGPTLLTVKAADGTESGMELDGKEGDNEFEIKNGRRVLSPIYRPIEPVQIGPAENVFVDQVKVTMETPTPGVEIRYTLDDADPTPQSPLYRGPVVVDHTIVVKARAYRAGTTEDPPDTSSTVATPVSRAVFTKSGLHAPVKVKTTEAGLNYQYFEGDWKRLWLTLDEVTPVKTGIATTLFENAKPRDAYYAVEYTGYLNVPADGVYTLHSPREYVMPDIDAGYELQVYLGNAELPAGYRTQLVGLNEWYPSTRLHAFGTWSIGLKAGLQPFKVVYVDYRNGAAAKLNKPGLNKYIWDGSAPDLEISGPGLTKQLIPAEWLRR